MSNISVTQNLKVIILQEGQIIFFFKRAMIPPIFNHAIIIYNISVFGKTNTRKSSTLCKSINNNYIIIS